MLAHAMTWVACTDAASPPTAPVVAPQPPPGGRALTADELAEAQTAFWPPSGAPHGGLGSAPPADRLAYRARFRAMFSRLAPFAEGSPSGLEMTWDDPERRHALAGVMAYLALDDFPALLRDDEHLGAPEAVAAFRTAVARILRRALTSADVDERLAVLAHRSVFDAELRLDPFERLGLGEEVSAAVAATDRETQEAAIDRLCAFEVPPADDATVDGLRAFLFSDAPRSDRSDLMARCANWILSHIATDRAVAVLIDELFVDPRHTDDAECAFDRVVEIRHRPLVRSAYLRAEAGYVSPHITFVNYAAPFLARLELIDVVREDLESDDAERVNRGLHWAARLPSGDARRLLNAFLLRSDVPDPPGPHDWGSAEGLRNSARYGLEWVDAHEEPRNASRCRQWACAVPTYGLTPYPSCYSGPPS